VLHVSARETLETGTAKHTCFHIQWLYKYYYPTVNRSMNVFTDINESEKYQILRKLVQRLSGCYLRTDGQTD